MSETKQAEKKPIEWRVHVAIIRVWRFAAMAKADMGQWALGLTLSAGLPGIELNLKVLPFTFAIAFDWS